MEDPSEGIGESEIGETVELLARTRRFLHELDAGSAVVEVMQKLAVELEDKLVRQVNDR